MKVRLLVSMIVALSAFEAMASDVSPFYRNQFVVAERDACPKGGGAAVDVSPFFKNQFVVTRAEACAAAERASARRAASTVADEAQGDRVMVGSTEPMAH